MDIVQQTIPHYIRELRAYAPGKPIAELAREKNLTRISKLASNENPLGPSPLALQEMSQALQDVHRYPDGQGYRLKDLLGKKWGLEWEEIILGCGSEGVLSSIIRTFVQQGEEVLTSEGSFVGFYALAQGVGAKIHRVSLDQDYGYDVEALKRNLSPRIKLFYIANPNNPTGTFITKEQLGELMGCVPEHCLVVLDQAYYEFACEYPHYPGSADYHREWPNMITTRTLSKAYGLSGVRVGYGFASKNLIHQLEKLRLPFEPNSLAQVAAVGALGDYAHLERTIQHNRECFPRVVTFLKGCGLTPINATPITNFVTFQAGSPEAAKGLAQALLDQGVIVRDLVGNALPGFIRVSIGSSEEMEHFFSTMKAVLPLWMQQFGVTLS